MNVMKHNLHKIAQKYGSCSLRCCTLLNGKRQNGNNHSPLPLTSRAIESQFCERRKKCRDYEAGTPEESKSVRGEMYKLKEVTDEGFSTFSNSLRKMAKEFDQVTRTFGQDIDFRYASISPHFILSLKGERWKKGREIVDLISGFFKECACS